MNLFLYLTKEKMNLENKIQKTLNDSKQLREEVNQVMNWKTQKSNNLESKKQTIFWFIILCIIITLFMFVKWVFEVNALYTQEVQKKIENEFKFYENEKVKWNSEVKKIKDDEHLVKIKLKRFVQDSTPRTDKVVITSDKPFAVYKNWQMKDILYERYEIEKREQDLMNTNNWKNEYYEFYSLYADTPLVIKSRDRIPSLIKDEDSRSRNNDNKFLWKIRYQNVNWEETYINEIPLEDYIKGIAETASRTHKEKKKAMSIIARSYIYFYTHSPFRKFEWKNYDLEDDPSTSQKYLGYGYQERNKEWVDIVEWTKNLVLVDQLNNPFIAPYSTCTLRNENWELKRKTLEQAKRWNEKKWNIYKFGTNVITDVDDQYWECDSKQKSGHWVWLSGNGSEKLASEYNYTYEQIIKYYFKNISIKNLNSIK